jgi:hypothetical protein
LAPQFKRAAKVIHLAVVMYAQDFLLLTDAEQEAGLAPSVPGAE